MGSLGFWPLTVFLPIEIHIAQRGIKRFSLQWTLMQCLSAFCFCISAGAMIGSIAGIIKVLLLPHSCTTCSKRLLTGTSAAV